MHIYSRKFLPCVPTGGGIFGGASRITSGGSTGGGGGRCPMTYETRIF